MDRLERLIRPLEIIVVVAVLAALVLGFVRDHSPMRSVQVRAQAFAPARVAGDPGTEVTWTFTSPGTVASAAGLFASGPKSKGATYEHSFDDAGTFRYVSRQGAARAGTVVVPVGTSKVSDSAVRLVWSVRDKALKTHRWDVQTRVAGKGSWQPYDLASTRQEATFAPGAPGRYQVRARTTDTKLGTTSGWSPPRAVTIN